MMKSNKVKINENDLHDMIYESINRILNKDNQINEIFGINHGLVGAAKSYVNGKNPIKGFKKGFNDYLNRNIVMSSWRKNNGNYANDDNINHSNNGEEQPNNTSSNEQPNNTTSNEQPNNTTSNGQPNNTTPNEQPNNNRPIYSKNMTDKNIRLFIYNFDRCCTFIKNNDINNGVKILQKLINFLNRG